MENYLNNKKECAIVFFITKNYNFAVANMIIGLNRYCKNLFSDIIVFYEEISDEEEKSLNLLSNRIIFKKNIKNDILNKLTLKVKNNKIFNLFIEKFSYQNIAKFEIFDLLHYYKNIVLCDIDMLIQKDFSEILTYKPAAWRTTTNPLGEMFNCNLYENIPKDTPRPNGGFIYISDELDLKNFSTEQCYILLDRYIQDIKGCIDECIFSLIFLKNKVSPCLLPMAYNCWPTYYDSHNAYIIHTIGKNKFWNCFPIKLAYPEWEINNKIWNMVGGKSYSGLVEKSRERYETPARFLSTMFNEEYWNTIYKTLFNNIHSFIRLSFDMSHRYYKLFLIGIKEDIHYELLRTKTDKEIQIALHCEDEGLLKNEDFKNAFINIYKRFVPGNFCLKVYDKKISIERTLTIQELIKEFIFFIDETHHAIYLLAQKYPKIQKI